MPNPYDKTTHDGKTVDWLTHCALLEAELKLGYRLTIVQGSYHKGVGASAGTHDGGGVIDLAPWDHVRKVRVLRDLGFAIWHRPALPGVWNEHCHGVLIGNEKLSPAAANQVPAYKNHRDGLASNRPDNTYRPDPIPTYKWPGSDAALALEAKAKTVLDGPKKPPTPTKAATSYVVDVSHYQSGLSVASLVKQGYAALIAKCTEGTTYADPTYDSWRTQAEKAGMPFAAYHFLHHGNPDKQADWLAKHIGDKSIPVMVDAEAGGKPTWGDVGGFLGGCEARGLKVALNYLPRSYWNTIGKPAMRTSIGLVEAAYTHGYTRGYASALYPGNNHAHWDPYGGVTPTLWQFTSSAKIDGYPGGVDVSAFRGPRSKLLARGLFKSWPNTPEDDMTPDQLLEALESDRGQAALQKALATLHVKRAGLGGEASKDVPVTRALSDLDLRTRRTEDKIDALGKAPAQ